MCRKVATVPSNGPEDTSSLHGAATKKGRPEGSQKMPRGYLAVRINPRNRSHHLYLNNGHYWVHYTIHFDFRKRRIRRSLKTRSLEVAIQRRDELFARLTAEGELVEERRMFRQPRPSWNAPARQSQPVGEDHVAILCESPKKHTPTCWVPV